MVNITDNIEIALLEDIAEPLNSEQKEAFYKLVEWYLDPESPQFHLLSGAAGTGKSFLIGRLVLALDKISKYRNKYFKVAAVAPTHKATGVLHDIFSGTNTNLDITIGTIHSAFHLIPGEYNNQGDRPLKVNPNAKGTHFSEFHLGIIDENSMISKELLYFIQTGVGRKQKVLLSGDKYQLPPVEKEKDLPKEYFQVSPVYELGYPEVSLVKPVRYAGAIAQFASKLRVHIEHLILIDAIKLVIQGKLEFDTLNDYLYSKAISFDDPLNKEIMDELEALRVQNYDYEDLIEALKKLLTKADYSLPFPESKPFPDSNGEGDNLITLTAKEWNKLLTSTMKSDSSSARAVAWTNKRVNDISNNLRTELFGDTEYHVGEKLIAREPIIQELVESGGFITEKILLQTCQEVEIIAVNEKQQCLTSPNTLKTLELDFVELTLRTDIKQEFKILTVSNSDLQTVREFFHAEKKHIINNPSGKKWREYYRMLNSICISVKSNTYVHRLAYANALTINISQGSGYPLVFIDWMNVYGCQNYAHRLRLAYTALTRAKQKAYILCKKENLNDLFSPLIEKEKANFYDDNDPLAKFLF